MIFYNAHMAQIAQIAHMALFVFLPFIEPTMTDKRIK